MAPSEKKDEMESNTIGGLASSVGLESKSGPLAEGYKKKKGRHLGACPRSDYAVDSKLTWLDKYD
jgi:hypothetical protein